MTTQTQSEDRLAKYVEQLEIPTSLEFKYNGDTYSIDATYVKTGDNTYRTDGRGFEIWKFDRDSETGHVIAFAEKAYEILEKKCFDGKTFAEIEQEIESL